MPAPPPHMQIASKLKKFREDLEQHNYVRIWLILTFVAVLVAFAGSVMIALQTKNTKQPSYRLSVLNPDRLQVPPLRFEIVSGNATHFGIATCATASNINIQMATCYTESKNPCLEMRTTGVMATERDNRLECVLATQIADEQLMVRTSLAANPEKPLFSTFTKSTNGAYIWLSETQFTTPNGVTSSHTITSEYYQAGHSHGLVRLVIGFSSFNIHNWVEWKPFSGWTAFGVIGGVFFLIWIVHGAFMRAVSLFYENPWEANFSPTMRHTEMNHISNHSYQPLNTEAPI